MADPQLRWQPMSREQFRELRRDQLLQDRARRVWTVHTPPHEEDGLVHVVIRSGPSGALVRRVPEPFADDYMLLPSTQDLPTSTG